MDNYIVSARKYRPDTFESVVGQENITRTLKNAITQQHLAQAYLFCGPRGVGKTTNARIFAKTINCSNLDEHTNPCNECESCQAFNEQRSMNIHELDAASNNSVDDIRNLIDQVRIPPQIGQYSVYIIDEVHMLSSAAFNAFLKTLEEPPKHAVFILATTEKHKILPTILSRCQVYDFNRISIRDIVARLAYVAQSENIQAEEEALQIIAQKADGGMRDALSIFDQIASFSGNNISYQDAIENLNVLDYDFYFKLTDAFLAADHIGSLLIFNDILAKGFEGNYFIAGLASHLRDMLISRDTKSTDLLEVGESIKKKYLEKSLAAPEGFIIKCLEISSDCDYKYKASHNKRLHVELAIIKMATLMRARKQPAAPQAPNNAPQAPTNAPQPAQPQQPVQQAQPQQVQNPIQEQQNTESVKAQSENPTVQEKSSRPQSQPAPTPNAARPMSFSIKAGLGKQTESKKTELPTDNKNVSYNKVEAVTDFDQDKLITVWKKISDQYAFNAPRLQQTLNSFTPKLLDGYKIGVAVPTESNAKMISAHRGEIMHKLQTELNNGKIDLLIKVMEQSDNKVHRAYTAEEKFKEMVESNEHVMLLRTSLDANLK